MILGSAADVAEYFFEASIMQAAACALGLIGTFRGPRDAGTAYVKLYHAMGMATGKRGAMGLRARRDGERHPGVEAGRARDGVDIRTGEEVDQICVEGGRATGAVTTDGEEFHARIVLSNADPKRTYLKLVGKQLPAGGVRARHRGHPDHLAGDEDQLRLDQLPQYPGAAHARLRAGADRRRLIGPSIEYMQRAYEDARQGGPPTTPSSRSTPSRRSIARWRRRASRRSRSSPSTSPTSWPRGPGTSGATRSPSTRSPRFAEYAPNMADAEITAQVLAPPDIEARFGLTGGHIFQGELVPEQAFDMRPVPGSQAYEGPIVGALPVRLRRLAGRLRDGRAGPQRRARGDRAVRAGEYG